VKGGEAAQEASLAFVARGMIAGPDNSRFPFDFAQGKLSAPLRCGRNDEFVGILWVRGGAGVKEGPEKVRRWRQKRKPGPKGPLCAWYSGA
jgi:hypothetical protein